MKNRLLFVLSIAMILMSCSNKKDPVIYGKPEGSFKGQFSMININPAVHAVTLTGEVTVDFAGSQYQSSGNSNYLPAGGKGTFNVQGQQLIFTDPNIHPANFDWNLLLNGTYNYKASNDTLILDKVVNMQVYKYVLIKQ